MFYAQILLVAFLLNTFGPLPARADEFVLPKPGTMVNLSPAFNPSVLKGIKVYPENPFRFDFILDKGDSPLPDDRLKDESSKLIKYFLASLTIPEKDLWVNLSPYEKDRIVPEGFGQTQMGRDLLAQDYLLKQITASVIYPEDEIGKRFWRRVYEESNKRFGTTNVSLNTFNKVWIVPERAVVYENAKTGTAYVIESKLNVMLEEDYLSLEKNMAVIKQPKQAVSQTNTLGSQIVREVVIPQLIKEVNEGRNFIQLRQVYNSLILATWYRKKITESALSRVYTDRNKVAGVNINDPQEKQKIYKQYLEAFKKGAYNYIKEETDPVTQQPLPRKYFSGGVNGTQIGTLLQIRDRAQISNQEGSRDVIVSGDMKPIMADMAMLFTPKPEEVGSALVHALIMEEEKLTSHPIFTVDFWKDYDGYWKKSSSKIRQMVPPLRANFIRFFERHSAGAWTQMPRIADAADKTILIEEIRRSLQAVDMNLPDNDVKAMAVVWPILVARIYNGTQQGKFPPETINSPMNIFVQMSRVFFGVDRGSFSYREAGNSDTRGTANLKHFLDDWVTGSIRGNISSPQVQQAADANGFGDLWRVLLQRDALFERHKGVATHALGLIQLGYDFLEERGVSVKRPTARQEIESYIESMGQGHLSLDREPLEVVRIAAGGRTEEFGNFFERQRNVHSLERFRAIAEEVLSGRSSQRAESRSTDELKREADSMFDDIYRDIVRGDHMTTTASIIRALNGQIALSRNPILTEYLSTYKSKLESVKFITLTGLFQLFKEIKDRDYTLKNGPHDFNAVLDIERSLENKHITIYELISLTLADARIVFGGRGEQFDQVFREIRMASSPNIENVKIIIERILYGRTRQGSANGSGASSTSAGASTESARTETGRNRLGPKLTPAILLKEWANNFNRAINSANWELADEILSDVNELNNPSLNDGISVAKRLLGEYKAVAWPFDRKLAIAVPSGSRVISQEQITWARAVLPDSGSYRSVMIRFHPDRTSNPNQKFVYELIFKTAGIAKGYLDSAMVAENGGIDLSSNRMLSIQNNGQDIKFHLDEAMLLQLQNAVGFTPVIINIQPVTDLRLFLGLNTSQAAVATS